jgi:5-methylcytosine-specific restriction endonuclease McrA
MEATSGSCRPYSRFVAKESGKKGAVASQSGKLPIVELAVCPVCDGVFCRRHAPSNPRILCSVRCRDRKSRAIRVAREGGKRVDRKAIFDRDDWTCCLCGVPVVIDPRQRADNQAQADHIVPLSHGGEHHESNMRTLCRRCNNTTITRLPLLGRTRRRGVE